MPTKISRRSVQNPGKAASEQHIKHDYMPITLRHYLSFSSNICKCFQILQINFCLIWYQFHLSGICNSLHAKFCHLHDFLVYSLPVKHCEAIQPVTPVIGYCTVLITAHKRVSLVSENGRLMHQLCDQCVTKTCKI